MNLGQQVTSSSKGDASEKSLLPVGYEKSLETIFVATDLSARSDRALRRALQLAKQHSARVIVSHIYDEDLPETIKASVGSAAEHTIETALKNVEDSKDIDVTVEVSSGSCHQGIVEKADACDADIIVMGTHRNETAGFSFSGTTLERVIRGGTIPTLVVANPVRGPYEKVMAGVDFSAYSRFAIRNAVALAGDASIDVVHAFHVPFGGFLGGADNRKAFKEAHEREMAVMIEEEMRALVQGSVDDIHVNQIVRHGEVRAILRNAIKEIKTDLLVLGTHGRVGLAHAVLGSVAVEFLNNPPCDVLVVKAW